MGIIYPKTSLKFARLLFCRVPRVFRVQGTGLKVYGLVLRTARPECFEGLGVFSGGMDRNSSPYMGSCQNDGSFLGTLNIRDPKKVP